MEKHNEQLEALQGIRDLMERSTRFVALSGISAMLVGITALLGTVVAYFYLGKSFSISPDGYFFDPNYSKWGWNLREFFLAWGIAVLGTAIAITAFFTHRLASKKGLRLGDTASKRSFFNFFFPNVVGVLVCLILLERGLLGIIAPMTLIFFGLACVHVSKYTFESIRYMGYIIVTIGLIALYFTGYGLLFWGLGFGVCIFGYGVYIYSEYKQ